jgi:hypothetical protein
LLMSLRDWRRSALCLERLSTCGACLGGLPHSGWSLLSSPWHSVCSDLGSAVAFGEPRPVATLFLSISCFPSGSGGPRGACVGFPQHSQSQQSYLPSSRQMVASYRQSQCQFPTRFMPDFVRLERDSTGRPVFPRRLLTSLVETRDEWRRTLGHLDAVTVIVDGKLVMPKSRSPLRGSPCLFGGRTVLGD